MVSIEGFVPSKRKGLLQQVAHYEVYALARLTFDENLLIGQETSARSTSMGVCIKQVDLTL